MKTPPGWDAGAQKLWQQGQKGAALQHLVAQLNQNPTQKPRMAILQCAYYLYCLNDYSSAVTLLQDGLRYFANDLELLKNLTVCLSKLGQHRQAIASAEAILQQQPDSVLITASLAHSYAKCADFAAARRHGTRSLWLKDQRYGQPVTDWHLPALSPGQFVKQKPRVIAFSLWGNQPRYLRGALRNMLLAPDIYPGWQLRFYLDTSVPAEFRQLLQQLGADLHLQPPEQSLREKLCWRFQVASDAGVGYFLVRDTDSVFSPREQYAVRQWLASEHWFHIIRDWWSHTDLILAGLWGGVAGILPDIQECLANYSPTEMETAHIDQWFLRDELWRYIKTSVMTHDRCFDFGEVQRLPEDDSLDAEHIGSDESVLRANVQCQILQPWISSYTCLA